MSVKLSEIIKVIEDIAPKTLAEDWDNVGLQVGSYKQSIDRVLLTLDITPEVIEEAVNRKIDLIIAHHPFIFKGLKTLSTDYEKGRLITQLIKNDIALYVAHTNLDKAKTGLNDFLAHKIGLESIRPLDPSNPEIFFKLVVYVPSNATEKIVEVFGKNGAGAIGTYDYCTFRSSGIGTFRPLIGSNPFIGQIDTIEEVKEDRIEAIIPGKLLKNLINQLKKNHPYEEMAYDVIPLENGRLMNHTGLGKIGLLKEPMMAHDFIQYVKKALNLNTLRGAGILPEMVRRVALCSGAGADLIGIAKSQKADVLITGDLKHHDGQRAAENNFWVLDAGHFGTEKWVTECLEAIIIAGLGERSPELITAESLKDYISLY
ncbi:MAG: Nif3-like dinuclear metal center hexameric protein [Eubacteriaceae bacterium]|nr:Nif3-like dinuclear metal center hexameric protein [Eubacteriaceae bacterium]